VERLAVLLVLGLLSACTPAPLAKDRYNEWDSFFVHVPPGFGHSVTALWIASYQEDPQTHSFVRSTAWGEIPEKLVPDDQGGYSVAVPLVMQSETSDGPRPDGFWTVMVRVLRAGDQFTLVSNEALPGEVVSWHDGAHRTVWFRGKTLEGGSPQTLWQFRGRY